jgi:hypothetical protein
MGGIVAKPVREDSLNDAKFRSVGSRKGGMSAPSDVGKLKIIPHIRAYEPSPMIINAINDNMKCLEETDDDKKTPLMWATEKGRQDVMEKLVANHVNIEARDSDGWTALMYSARRGNVAVFKYLIDQGAVLTHTTLSDGFTALHLACGNECVDMVVALIEHGADPEVKDRTGKAPGFYLKSKIGKDRLHTAIAKLLADGKTPAEVREFREEKLSEKVASRKIEQYTKAASHARSSAKQ